MSGAGIVNPEPAPQRRADVEDGPIGADLVDAVCERLAANKRVRRTLPMRGRLHIDRQLPFLCVHRLPPGHEPGGAQTLVTAEASYLIASGAPGAKRDVSRLVQRIAETLSAKFGAFLVLELWEGPAGAEEPDVDEPGVNTPRFRIVASEGDAASPYVEVLRKALSAVRIAQHPVHAEVMQGARLAPPGLPPILRNDVRRRAGCAVLGLEIRPIYRDAATGKTYPLVMRAVQRTLTRALRRAFHEFSCTRTTHCPVHYDMLGRRAMVKAVWEVDQQLAAVSSGFDLLLQTTPVNAVKAWREFGGSDYERAPKFRYRPLPIDPVLLKRKLYRVPVERVEDPVLLELFRDKQAELDRQITLLLERNTPRFSIASELLYGAPRAGELRLARKILDALPARSRESASRSVGSKTLARRAEEEIAHYRAQWSGVTARVLLRGDIAGGMMVSRGSLLVSRSSRIPASRVNALLQHEVGTHIVTYYNGRAQPFKLLASGLAGYESLQEGIAVLAEHLVGGLSRPRLRLLAARVVAVQSMIAGASFVETFRMLSRDHGLGRHSAYQVTMRIYRGGGLTKDAIYLRGLVQVLEHLARGGSIEPLFVGKIALGHIPIVRKLQWRQILRSPPLRPRFLDHPGAAARLERVRQGAGVLDLVEKARRSR